MRVTIERERGGWLVRVKALLERSWLAAQKPHIDRDVWVESLMYCLNVTRRAALASSERAPEPSETEQKG